MKRKILIAVLSFVLLFVGFIPVMSASSYSNGTAIESYTFPNIYLNTNISSEKINSDLSKLDYTYQVYNIYQVRVDGITQSSIVCGENQDTSGEYAIVIIYQENFILYDSKKSSLNGDEEYNENGFNLTTIELLKNLNFATETEIPGVYEISAYTSFVGNDNAVALAGTPNDDFTESYNLNYYITSFLSSTMYSLENETTYTPLVFNIFETIGNIATGFGGLVVSLFTSAFNLIYNNGTLTTLGIFILIGLATGLLIWAFVFIRRLIKIRSK